MDAAVVRGAVSKAVTILCGSAVIIASTGPAAAQNLDNGLSQRIKPLSDGAQPQYDDQGNIKAGYFRLRIDPVGLQTATVCPKRIVESLSATDKKRWKEVGGALVDVVFKRNFTWGIDATITLRPGPSATDPKTASVTLSLIIIKDPKKGNCQIKIGGATGASTVDYESFLVPLGIGPLNYSDRLQIDLRSSHTSELDKSRVDTMWNGVLKPIVGAVFAPATTVVGAVSDQAEPELISAMNKNVIASYPITFKADPGTGNTTTKVFIKLDFVDLPKIGGTPSTSSGGVTMALQYQASIFLRDASFYKDITSEPADIISTVVRTPSGDQHLDSQLDQGHLNQLRYVATTPETFESACAAMRSDLVKFGLSTVDTAVYVWALASANAAAPVRGNVWAIPCIAATTKDLARVGIKPPKAPDPVGRKATLAEMHKAMDNLAALMQLGHVDPALSDLTQRFTPQITLIVDEPLRELLRLDDTVTTRDRDVILQVLALRFSKLGCYGPRLSSPDLQLPMRPDFPPPLGANERASAAIGLFGGRGDVGSEPKILSFKFAPVGADGLAKVAVISIAARGADAGPVIKELSDGRRPKSCTENWMDPIFAK